MADSAQKSSSKAVQATQSRRAPERSAPATHGTISTFDALGTLHAWGGNGAVSQLVGGGAPLAPDLRSQMESRFGAEFSDVRIHDDPTAHAAAAKLEANAYTVGSNIVFAADRFSTHTPRGRQLVAHELAHVMQQRRGGAPPPLSTSAPHEGAADAAASAFASGTGPVAVQGATGIGVARDASDKKKTPNDFYDVALGGNRMYYWGIGGVKTPTDWPGNDKLKELWGSLGIPPAKPEKSLTNDHKLSHQREFVDFVDRVRDFQESAMGRKGKGNGGANGIVDTETARRLNETQAAAKKDEADKAAAKKAEEDKAAAKKAEEDKAELTKKMQGVAHVAGSTVSGSVDASTSLLDVFTDPSGKALDYAVGQIKRQLVDAVLQGIGIPPAGGRIANALAKGMGEQIATELITNGKGRKFLGHLKDFKALDVPQLYKGYLVGLGEGLVSPVTDLWGLVVFGEGMKNVMEDLLVSAFNRGGNFDQELKDLMKEVDNLYKKLGDFWEDVKANKLKTIAAILSAPQALEDRATDLAYDLGKKAGTSIVDGLEDPWRPKKEEKEPDPLRSPAAYVDYMAKKGQDYVIDTPWAKVGFGVGYGIGWVAIQVILIVFTEGIGNAIEEVAQALSKAGKVLGEFSKLAGAAVGKIAEFLEWIGKGATAAEKLFGKAIEKIVEKLPFLGKILEPISAFFEKLQKFLRKLFGVVEKDGALLLEEAAGKLAPKIGEELPKPPPKPPPPEVKPNVPPKARAEPKPKIEPEPKPKIEPEPKPKVEPEPKPKVEPEPKVKIEPKPNVQPEPKAKIEPKPKAKAEPKPKAKAEPKPKAKPKPKPKAKSKAKPAAKAAPAGKAADINAFEKRLKALDVPADKRKAFEKAAEHARKLAQKDPEAAERMLEGLEERFGPKAPKSGVQDAFDEAQGKVGPDKGPSGKHTQSTAAEDRARGEQNKPSRKKVQQERNRESEKLGDSGGRVKAEADGIKISEWDTPQQWKGDFGRGIDRIGTRGDKTVILEWKYGGSGLSKSADGTVQMSNEWVGRKIAELEAVGDKATAAALLDAAEKGKLQGAVYHTRELKAGETTSRLRSHQLRDKLGNESISEAGLINYSPTKVRAAYEKRLADLKAAIQRGDLKGLKNL